MSKTVAGSPMANHNRLPDFIIIGAMKSGTTSLFNYLAMHPEISRCALKEPSFFTHKNNHGLKWYEKLFPDNNNLKFEASTNYTKYPVFDNVPERMHRLLPDIKLIYMIRHPMDRVVSQIHHMIAHGHFRKKVVLHDLQFWQRAGLHAIDVSMYYMQFKQYLKYYDQSQILVIRFEDLIADTHGRLNQVLDFIGLDSTYYNDEFAFIKHNVSRTRTRFNLKALPSILRVAFLRLKLPSKHSLMNNPVPKPELTPQVQEWIWNQIADDLAQFETVLGRKLDYHAPVW
jgi:hypothetical protein